MTCTCMADSSDTVLMRIYIGENDRYQNQPLYKSIVLKAREEKLAGATVLRGAMGFGRSSRLHKANFLDISEDLPLVIEIVDEACKVEAFRPHLRAMMGCGLVTIEKVEILCFGKEPVSAGL